MQRPRLPPRPPREALLPVIYTPNEADLGWVECTGPLPARSPEEGSGRNDKCGKHPELRVGSTSPMERDPKGLKVEASSACVEGPSQPV